MALRPGKAWRRAPALLRPLASLLRLVGQLLLLSGYWTWRHRRATAALRRALREAGLPPEAVIRLSRGYAALGPLEIVRHFARAR